jgi:hypothetical protein
LLRAAAQKVDSPANSPFHPGRRTAAYIVVPDRRAALGALAGQDAVLRQNAARFPESSPERVRDCLSATVEKARQGALPARQVPQRPGAPRKVALQTELQIALRQVPLSAAQLVERMADGSVWAPEASSLALSALAQLARRALQPVVQPAQQPAQWIQEQPEPQEQQAARLAQTEPRLAWHWARPRAPEVLRPRWDRAPLRAVPTEPQAASALPWQQLPSERPPPSQQSPPQPQLPPVPKCSCGPSLRHPRGSSSSASSSP